MSFKKLLTITCATFLLSSVSAFAKGYELKSLNDDGSTTLIRPTFKLAGQERFIIKNDASIRNDGTCKVFGFNGMASSEALENEIFYNLEDAPVVIDKNGNFKSSGDRREYVIHSITCI